MKKMVLKTVIGILLVCSLFVGFLYISSDIGIASGNLETDIRSSQKIKEVGRSMEVFLTRWLHIFLIRRT